MISFSEKFIKAGQTEQELEQMPEVDLHLLGVESVKRIHKNFGPNSLEFGFSLDLYFDSLHDELDESGTKFHELWFDLGSVLLYLELGYIKEAKKVFAELVINMDDTPNLEDETIPQRSLSLIQTYDRVHLWFHQLPVNAEGLELWGDPDNEDSDENLGYDDDNDN